MGGYESLSLLLMQCPQHSRCGSWENANMALEQNTARRFIRRPEVQRRVGLSRPQIYKMIAGNAFPPPVKVGHASMWIESEIDSWIADRIAESRGGAAA